MTEKSWLIIARMKRTCPGIFADVLATVAKWDNQLNRKGIGDESGYNDAYVGYAIGYLMGHGHVKCNAGGQRGWSYELTESGRIAHALVEGHRAIHNARARATSQKALALPVAVRNAA